MSASLLIISPTAVIYITPERYKDWRDLADVGGHLLWSRDGMLRRVATDVLDNALEIYDSYCKAVLGGRLVWIPEEAKSIRWEQAETIRDRSRPIRPQ